MFTVEMKSLVSQSWNSTCVNLRNLKLCKFASILGFVVRCETFQPRKGPGISILSLIDQSSDVDFGTFEVVIKHSYSEDKKCHFYASSIVYLSRVSICASKQFRNLTGSAQIGENGFSAHIFSLQSTRSDMQRKCDEREKCDVSKILALKQWVLDSTAVLESRFYFQLAEPDATKAPQTTFSSFPHTAYRDISAQVIGCFFSLEFHCLVIRVWDGTKTSRIFEKIDLHYVSSMQIIDLDTNLNDLLEEDFAIDIFIFNQSIKKSLEGLKRGNFVHLQNLHSYSKMGSSKAKFVMHDNTGGAYKRDVLILNDFDPNAANLKHRLDAVLSRKFAHV